MDVQTIAQQKEFLFVLLIISSLFIISCATEIEDAKKDVIVADEQLPVEEQAVPVNQVVSERVSLPPEFQELMKKGKNVNNYRYLFSSRIKDRFGNYIDNTYDISIKEDKTKKTYLSPIKLSDNSYYDTIYLNLADGTAKAVCADIGKVLCKGLESEVFDLAYSEEKLDYTPKSLLDIIPSTIKKQGKGMIENREVLVFIDETPLTLDKYYVDTYSGLVLKWEKFSIIDDEQVLEESRQFNKISIGTVKNSEVSLS